MKKSELKVGMEVYADGTKRKKYEVVDLSNTDNGWVGLKDDDGDTFLWFLSNILAVN